MQIVRNFWNGVSEACPFKNSSFAWPYRERLGVRKIIRLPPEEFFFRWHARFVIVGQLIPVLHFNGAVNSHGVDDVHLIRRYKLILPMIVLPPAVQIFRPVQPTETNINMLRAQRADFQDLRFPLRVEIKFRIVAFVVLYKNTFARRNAFRSNYNSRQSHVLIDTDSF